MTSLRLKQFFDISCGECIKHAISMDQENRQTLSNIQEYIRNFVRDVNLIQHVRGIRE